MVFFTCLLITVILYYLQADGLIYVTIVAVFAELINLFMTQTMTATVKNRTAKKYGKIINDYKTKMVDQAKTIKQLKKVRDNAIQKLYKANQSIKKYEEELGIEDSEAVQMPTKDPGKPKISPPPPEEPDTEGPKTPEERFVDLPAGSNRKELPI